MPPPPNTESSVIVETEGTSRRLTEAEFAEFQPHNNVLAEALAPNGISRIITQTTVIGDRALTSVSISLAGGAGAIYAARGASLPINAYWKDNHTVVIETKNEYEANTKCRTVRSFDELITIEYVDV
ncbi:hypothetical protein [Pedobacter sp. GR22-6]|uniref:hypothetical protein n=1 Tax=Pedobacter sp. GR22-6 TaxID=3127957 RepID=UPI00307F13CE